MKDKNKYPFLRIALASVMQIPEETLVDLPVISVTGKHRLSVENYSSIMTYEPEKIVLVCPKISIVILGKRLNIVRLNHDEILIEGDIQNIGYH